MTSELPPAGVLDAWDLGPGIGAVRLRDGLINPTWRLQDVTGPLGALQELNLRIFRPEVHENIEAVTAHLEHRGLLTPRLIRTRTGALWHTTPEGRVWRLLTWVGHDTFHTATPALAREAGRLVGRFHAALDDLDWPFPWYRRGVHDTDAHAARLRAAVDARRDHRLRDAVAPLADELLDRWERLRGELPALPERVVHGDLKISNVRFSGGRAVALIDLDTVAPGTLGEELGDALRSWCGTAGEDTEEAAFDLDVFEVAVGGWLEGQDGRQPPDGLLAALVPSVERIATELAMRFATDALEESYFGWDARRFPAAGEHNLVRARGQAALARAIHTARAEAERRLPRPPASGSPT